MKIISPLLFSLAIVSCASSSDDKKSTTEKKYGGDYKPLSQRMEETNGYVQDADGNWKPKSDKRSAFEAVGEDQNFKTKGSFATKEYKTGEVSKKSWWGSKEVARKEYVGNTDGSRFMKTSRYQSEDAREAGRNANLPGEYKTGTYATGAARETRKTEISRAADAATEQRRGLFAQPPEVDYRQVRSLSIEQSKGILGR